MTFENIVLKSSVYRYVLVIVVNIVNSVVFLILIKIKQKPIKFRALRTA